MRENPCGPSYSEIVLDRQRYRGRTEVEPQLAAEPKFSSYMDDVRQRMVLELEAEVLTHKVAESTYSMKVPYPESLRWKYRDRWWMKPVLKLWPISYASKEGVVTLSKEHRFPESTIRYPDHLGRVVVVEQGRLDYADPSFGPHFAAQG